MSAEDRLAPLVLPFLAVLVASLASLALHDASYLHADGAFGYPLAEVYEALTAPAGQPMASPVWPLLLIPGTGTAWHAWLPLAWNALALVLAAALWGGILWRAGYGTSLTGMILAMAGPVALNFVGVAFLGAEQTLLVAACLAIVAGLVRFSDTGRVGLLLALGVAVAPLLRVEALLLAVPAALTVVLRGRIAPGLLLALLAVVPLLALSRLNAQSGLAPVPAEWLSALNLPGSDAGLQQTALEAARPAVSDPNATVLAGFLLVGLLVLFVSPWRKSAVAPILVAGLAHLAVGGFGEFNRLEIHVVAALAAVLLASAVAQRALQVLVLIPVIHAATVYVPTMVNVLPDAPAAVLAARAGQ